jgi:cytochrome c oxidase subunit 3
MTSPHTEHHVSHLRVNQVGLWLFILSESCLFSALIGSRYYLEGLDRPHELNQFLGLLITGVLLVSSLTAYQAEKASQYGDLPGFLRNMLWTLLLGGLFVAGVGIEWAEAFHAFPPSTSFGTIFFTLTGLHAFHVVSGLGMLLVVFLQNTSGKWGPGNNWAVEGTVKYWHFVDVAWVFIYPTLYLVG